MIDAVGTEVFDGLRVLPGGKGVRQAPVTPVAEQLEAEGAALVACTQTEEFRRAVAAFLKR